MRPSHVASTSSGLAVAVSTYATTQRKRAVRCSSGTWARRSSSSALFWASSPPSPWPATSLPCIRAQRAEKTPGAPSSASTSSPESSASVGMVPRFAKYRALATAFSAKLVPRSRSASSGNRSRNWSTGNVSSNGRPVNRSRISRTFPSLRVAINNFIAGSSRRLAAQPREQRGRRSAGHERHAHYPPAPPFDLVRPDDRGPRIVRSFHEHVGAEALDQRERRLLVEQHDTVDAGESGEQAGTLLPGHDGAIRPLSQASHRRVAVHTHDQRPTLGARRF